ncbi:hypothetical protein Vadar_033614 [Vaccinium darrowii]|uniref:Uncharacterized protein n=1 Tax=Vaccinium darrowii TaxID=229202 RepID=A0ACB7YRL6_9ERIC|nr:hypothetical protein Vadar_033614 [Vaccinium darrowii]
MKSKWRILAALFALILLHILMVSSLHFPHEKEIISPRERHQVVSRKLLFSSGNSVSENQDTLSSGRDTTEPKEAVYGQTKKQIPPTGSNPSQNK